MALGVGGAGGGGGLSSRDSGGEVKTQLLFKLQVKPTSACGKYFLFSLICVFVHPQNQNENDLSLPLYAHKYAVYMAAKYHSSWNIVHAALKNRHIF